MSDEILAELITAVRGVDSRLERIESRLDLVESRLGRIESRLERLESAHISVRTDVMAQLDRFQTTLDEVKDDITVNFHANSRIERIARTSNVETRALADRVTALQRQVMHLNGRITSLESRG
jgi:hypothetical protein